MTTIWAMLAGAVASPRIERPDPSDEDVQERIEERAAEREEDLR